MEKLTHMISMERDEADQKADAPCEMSTPRYPWGLCITLTQDELTKLGVDESDWEVDDTFHLHALAKITSISKNATMDGEQCCVSMQIIALAGEDEDSENEEYENETE